MVQPTAEQITRYGLDMGCDGIEGVARFGFWKYLQADGFEKSAAFYEKGMKNGVKAAEALGLLSPR